MNKFVSAFALALTSYCISSASAAEPSFAANDGATPEGPAGATQAFQITPYLWAAELHGHISPFRRGPTVGVDKSFSKVLDDLRLGGFIDVWGRSGPYVLSGDLAYVDTRESRASGPLPGIGPVPPGATVKGRVDSKLFMATLQGGYRVVDTPVLTVDALAGLRVWHVSNKVKVSALGRSRSYAESFGWVDPVIGARAFARLTDKLSVQALANIGGFGVGSRLAWSAQATVNYAFTDHLSVSAGYKVLDVNYERKGHVFDTQLRGPVLGLTYRF